MEMEPGSIAGFLPAIYLVESYTRTLSGGQTGKKSGGRRRALMAGFGLVLVSLSFGTAQAIRASVPGSVPRTVEFVPGPDSSATCVALPCGQVTTGSEGVKISMSIGIDAETYYTELLLLTNPTTSYITVTGVAVSGVSASRETDFGAITVFYCEQQSMTPLSGCSSSFTIGSTAGGSVFLGNDTLAPGAVRYIEFAGFASGSAHPGDSISFVLQVTSQ
jgi:hypothetical protein